jgi:hypothetical protein
VSTADSGSSLIETVVGITLLGLVLVGVVDASWTNARVAATSRHRALAAALLDDSLRTLDDLAYSPCPNVNGSYRDALESAMASDDNGRTAEISRYEYWSESQSMWVDFTDFESQNCSTTDDLNVPFAAQRLTVSIFAPLSARGTHEQFESSAQHGPTLSGVIVKVHVPHP